jgi:FHS family L-fucose permease-like MFS transporter
MSPAELDAYRTMEAGMIRGPYLVIAGIFVVMAAIFWRAHLPEVAEEKEIDAPIARQSIWAYPHLLRGVIAQFLYVGAQVGVASFVIRFVQRTLPGTPEKTAAEYLTWHLFGFMIGRVLTAGTLKYVRAPVMLAAFAVGALVASTVAVAATGAAAVWMVVGLGFFHSLMFPTIFALSLEGLGRHTKLGASLLVMSIVGGAILPAVMGWISDLSSIQTAFAVPLVCYAYVLYFAMRGHVSKLVGATP